MLWGLGTDEGGGGGGGGFCCRGHREEQRGEQAGFKTTSGNGIGHLSMRKREKEKKREENILFREGKGEIMDADDDAKKGKFPGKRSITTEREAASIPCLGKNNDNG